MWQLHNELTLSHIADENKKILLLIKIQKKVMKKKDDEVESLKNPKNYL